MRPCPGCPRNRGLGSELPAPRFGGALRCRDRHPAASVRISHRRRGWPTIDPRGSRVRRSRTPQPPPGPRGPDDAVASDSARAAACRARGSRTPWTPPTSRMPAGEGEGWTMRSWFLPPVVRPGRGQSACGALHLSSFRVQPSSSRSCGSKSHCSSPAAARRSSILASDQVNFGVAQSPRICARRFDLLLRCSGSASSARSLSRSSWSRRISAS